MIRSACDHSSKQKYGKDRHGNQRFRCNLCGQTWIEEQDRPLGAMRVPVESAKMVLRLLTEGSSIRSTERVTGVHRDTICRLIVLFGTACKRFLDQRRRGLTLSHLQFDEQWTYVAKKQSRLTTQEREQSSEQGEIYLWTCIDQKTKLMPSFLIGKRSADNARCFTIDIAGRVVFPKPHASNAHSFQAGGHAGYLNPQPMAFRPIVRQLTWLSAPTCVSARP